MSESQRRRRPARPAPNPGLAPDDPLRAFGDRLRKIDGLDDLARSYPGREITVGRQRQQLEFFSDPDRPNAFAMVALEFFLVIAQYYREALPLRLILLLIAGQRAGGRIPLTQDDMAEILDVPRQKVNLALREVMSHGIVIKRGRGVYQFNPPYSYVAAELVRLSDGSTEYVQVDQADALAELRAAKLPDLVRFPSLQHMREAIDEFRKERAVKRRERRERFEAMATHKEGER
ncbi:helix-turn-helix domain-containing protein [Streptomyces sp. NPDC101175]|uniref:helix-turn-helix domain-containing protein n=1 Tax=Streptomyces sp. NPDC101175 TaxID=3366123 RepID=UPI0038361A0D